MDMAKDYNLSHMIMIDHVTPMSNPEWCHGGLGILDSNLNI